MGRHGRMERVVPGEVIDDFATWPYANQQALLRSGHVEKVGAHYAANLSTEGGYLHFAPAPALPDPPKVVQVAVQVQASPGKAPVHSRLSDSIEATFELPHPCPHCAKSFGRERGLKRHLSSSHKGGL
ncbi:MAG: hypothetical protein EOO40_00315 [Deltaproteobacteria bacterium]|nr:MAG: hypothetical protein EOO40_00315 [Deltaproteobacteria bacterium]